MTVLEIISFAQRVIGDAQNDIKERRTESANSKLELLGNELSVLRKDYEEPAEEGGNDAPPVEDPMVSNDTSFIDNPTPPEDVVEEPTETTTEE